MRGPVFLSAVAASFVALAAAAPSSHHVLHEKREGAPIEWNKHSRAMPHEILPVRIGLRQRNLEHADRFLDDISNPASPNFGKHWSAERVANTFAPAKETSDKVLQWLSDAGVHPDRISLSNGHNWVQFDAPVGELEELLKTEYHYFKHQDGGYRIACDSYHLPQHVQEHIDFAMPTVQLDGLRPVANVHPATIKPSNFTGLMGLSNCNQLVTIECLRALYGFNYSDSAQKGNSLGIGEWSDYLYRPDLPLFFKNYTDPQVPANTLPEFISIDGGKMSNKTVAEAGLVIESALDFQTAYAIIYPQQITQYQVGDSVNVDSVGTFNIFLDALDASYCTSEGGDQPYVDPEYPDPNEGGYTGPLQCGGAPITHTMSFSYNQIENSLPYFYQHRQCNEWMKLALQGVSVLFAAGDSGVANRYNSGYLNSCLNKDEPYVDVNGTRFSPSFPPSCPYITAVGATQLVGPKISQGEMAVNQPDPNNTKLDYYSGGGFSNVFTLPSYQASAVKNYLSKYPPGYGPNVYNDTGNARAYPDISAVGLNLPVVYLGETIAVGGTSASTPIVASLITLINEQRIKAGKKPVGFLNPTLYANPDAFNDITEGSNPGCGTNGFKAQPGWDPVTGMGTPKYEKLMEVFMALP